MEKEEIQERSERHRRSLRDPEGRKRTVNIIDEEGRELQKEFGREEMIIGGLGPQIEEPEKEISGSEKKIVSETEIDTMLEKAEITQEEKGKLKEVLMEHRERFSNELQTAGVAKFEPHKIRTDTDRIIHVPQHKISWTEKEILEAEMEKLRRSKAIRQSWSSYNSVVMVVRKKELDA